MDHPQPWIRQLVDVALGEFLVNHGDSRVSHIFDTSLFDFKRALSNLRAKPRVQSTKQAQVVEVKESRSHSSDVNAILQDGEYSFRALLKRRAVEDLQTRIRGQKVAARLVGSSLRVHDFELYISDCFDPPRIELHISAFDVTETSTGAPRLPNICESPDVLSQVREYSRLKAQGMDLPSAVGTPVSLSSPTSINGRRKGSLDGSDVENHGVSQHGFSTQVPSSYLEKRPRRRLGGLLSTIVGQPAHGQRKETSTQAHSAQMVHHPASPAEEQPSAGGRRDPGPELHTAAAGLITDVTPTSRQASHATVEKKCGSPPDKTSDTFTQKARDTWGKVIPRYYQTISKNQVDILVSPDSWRPPLVGRTACAYNIPIDILNRITEQADGSTPSQEPVESPSAASTRASPTAEARDPSRDKLPDSPARLTEENLSLMGPDISEASSGESISWVETPPSQRRPKLRLPPDSPPLGHGTADRKVEPLNLDERLPTEQEIQGHGGVLAETFLERNETPGDEGQRADHIEDKSTEDGQNEDPQPSNIVKEDSVERPNPQSSDGTAPSQTTTAHSRTLQVKRTPYPLKPDVPDDETKNTQHLASRAEVRTLPPNATIFLSPSVVPSTFEDPRHLAPKQTNSDATESKSNVPMRMFRGESEEDSSSDQDLPINLRPGSGPLDARSSPPVVEPVTGRPVHIGIDAASSQAEMSTTAKLDERPQSSPLIPLSQCVEREGVAVPLSEREDNRCRSSKRKSLDDDTSGRPKKARMMDPPPPQSRRSGNSDYEAVIQQTRQARRAFWQDLHRSPGRAKSARSPSLEATRGRKRDTAISPDLDHARQCSATTVGHRISTSETCLSPHKLGMHPVGKQGSTPASNPETSKLQALYTTFRREYATYNGRLEDFRKACKLIQELEEINEAPHRCLWDDFIFKRAHDYRQYLADAAESGDDAMDYKTFYNTLDDVQIRNGIISPEVLHSLFDIELFRGREVSVVSSSRGLPSRRSRPSLDPSITARSSFTNGEPRRSSVLHHPLDGAPETVNRKERPLEPQATNNSQHLPVQLWIEKIPGAESPDLATPNGTLRDIDIPALDLSQNASPKWSPSPNRIPAKATKPTTRPPSLNPIRPPKPPPEPISAPKAIPATVSVSVHNSGPATHSPSASSDPPRSNPPRNSIPARAVPTTGAARKETHPTQKSDEAPTKPQPQVPPQTAAKINAPPTPQPPTSTSPLPSTDPVPSPSQPGYNTEFTHFARSYADLHSEKTPPQNPWSKTESVRGRGDPDVRRIIDIFTWRG